MSVLDKLAAKTTKTEAAPGKTGGPHARFEDGKSATTGRGPAAATGDGTRSAPTTCSPLLAAKKVIKSYRKGKVEVPVLRGVDFQIQPGRFTAIIGASGCGKSTLLHLLGTLD
ncbi:MAG: ATP-binding cassette domain-containing protein, partial [Opitutaceae bacterium]